jgi:chemotaxis protein MotB
VKKKKSGGGGGANWMDTYGDMVTLLLCFFVLLYSMSTVSEENWKAIVMSFNPEIQAQITAAPGGNGPNADSDDGNGGPILMLNMSENAVPVEVTEESIQQALDQLYDQLQNMAEQNNMQSSISVTKGDGKVFVTFNQATFFDGDSYKLRDESLPILNEVSSILDTAKDSIDEVRILGHTAQATADTPNNVRVDRFLASNRATNVLVYIQEHCSIDPGRLVSEGWGQWRPVAANDTPQNRAQNRRVEMIISGRDLDAELESSLEQYTTNTSTAEAQPSANGTSSGTAQAQADSSSSALS